MRTYSWGTVYYSLFSVVLPPPQPTLFVSYSLICFFTLFVYNRRDTPHTARRNSCQMYLKISDSSKNRN